MLAELERPSTGCVEGWSIACGTGELFIPRIIAHIPTGHASAHSPNRTVCAMVPPVLNLPLGPSEATTTIDTLS
jgi:hypothetical protein